MICVTIILHVVQGLWFRKDIEKKNPLPISEWVDSSFVCFVLWFVWGGGCQMFAFLFFVCTSLLLKFSDFLYLLLIFYKDFIVSSDSIRFYNDQRTTTLHREWPVLRSAKRAPANVRRLNNRKWRQRYCLVGERFAERSTGHSLCRVVVRWSLWKQMNGQLIQRSEAVFFLNIFSKSQTLYNM